MDDTGNNPVGTTMDSGEQTPGVKLKAEEPVSARSRLLALVDHEIRDPIKGVLDIVQLLIDTDLSTEQRGYVEKAHESGAALLTINNDIRDLAKIEAGQMCLETIDFDLHTTVTEVVTKLNAAAHSKNREATSLIHHDVPTLVRGDPGRLRQVLTHFLSDVIRSTYRDEIVLGVKVVPTSQDGVTIRFEVTEAEEAFSLKVCEGAVDATSQQEVRNASEPQNTGLGFALSRRLTELMGGEFGVEGGPPEGCTVWFSVRLGKTPRGDSKPRPPREDLRGLAALAVVDNEAISKNLVAQTLSWGMSCDVALGAPQALEKLRAAASRDQPVDVVILDMQVQGANGLDLARAIHGNPAFSKVRSVLMISVGLRGHAEESRLAGIAGYLTKPVNQSELYDCLTAVMRESPKDAAGGSSVPQPFVTSHNLKEEKAQRRPHALVAEDNKVNQMVAVRMLEKLGIRADVAVNGLGAVEACQRTHYDFILMDCQMPEMDGFEATRSILDSEPARGGPHVPIIAVTANAMKGDREKCLASGMDDYLAKPFKIEQLRALLERWMPPATAEPYKVEPVAASHQGSAVDARVLNAFSARAGDGLPHFVSGLKEQFLTEARFRLAAISEAVGHGEASALKQAAYALKGSSTIVGATAMAGLCADLEQSAQQGGMTGAAALAAQLENEFGRVREEFAAAPSV